MTKLRMGLITETSNILQPKNISSLYYTRSLYFSKDNKDGKGGSPIQEDLDPILKDIRNPQGTGKDFESQEEELKKEDENEDENSFNNENKKGVYFLIVSAVALVAGYFAMQVNALRDEKKSTNRAKVSYSGRADIGGPWKLIDTEGNIVTSKDYKGAYYLIYFGFCNCPDVCPQSLHKISKALELIRKMPEAKYVKLKTVFVSVDPDRDTPERIKKFLKLFDSSIVGLTGKSNDDPELRDCMKKFKIYASKIELDDGTKKSGPNKPYTLDHTIITYLMTDDNNYLTHLGSNMSDRDLANTIVDKIIQNETQKASK
eukprot:CAMPEP_0176438084 /NCGR_PEP_ID=MMETSP0127-20121128/19056_1 /TAXON_ID=938130 /ORGANISM="Platyophrya macrostoma, Strain WH" /LENGTH=315 /DNA_ID=CAMNT_0017821933 /DNA_START=65 /DNA_END=1012 /DNA_ORIENTATION=+